LRFGFVDSGAIVGFSDLAATEIVNFLRSNFFHRERLEGPKKFRACSSLHRTL
jgi:hypothetical protein